MAQFNAKSTSYDSRIKLVDKFLDNMTTQHQKTGMSGVLLAGDPGVGKTSFVRFFSALMGIKLIIIEAPHITEEHIINIPFIVYDPSHKSEKDGVAAEKEADYKIILSQSHLVSQINHIQKIPDDQYIQSIYRAPRDVQKIFESYGGTKDKVPEEFQEIRDNFKALLFLDEFYRQTSTRIRNMLRGILNGKIGTDRVPPGTYVMYASNLEDNNDAVEGMPLNHQYAKTIEFKAPNKDDWFGWLVEKFENDKHVKLNKRVVDEFYTILKEEHINHNDAAKEVRVSPRRWEQLILYVNANIPCKNEKEAKSLLTNVKLNFKNYLTGEHADLVHVVLDAVARLIKETSGIEISKDSTNDDADWRDTLEHQIATKMKLGEHRKYIPIMSGMPGVGKTTHAAAVAEHLNLRYVHIDCSTLDPEDVIGIPLSKTNQKDGKDSVETKFSSPKLYQQIVDECNDLDKEYLADLREEGDKDKIEAYKHQHFKYMIFFDELNRTSAKVFNGLRRVILEKSFGDDRDLPDGSIVIAAINPSDHGASELTHHMRDVVDVVDTGASWTKTKKYLTEMKVKVKNEVAKKVALESIELFANKFKTKGSSDIKSSQRQFYLDVGADTVYISPREYSDLYSNTAVGFDRQFTRIFKGKDLDNDELKAAEMKLRETLAESFQEAMKTIMHKQDVDSPSFMEDLHTWFMHSDEIDIGEDVFYKKTKAADFPSIVDPYFNDPKKNLVDDAEFINYINAVEPQTFKGDLIEFAEGKLKDAESILANLRDKKHPKKVVTADSIKHIEEEQISKFEHFFRELVQTFEIHKLSNDKRQAVKEASSEALKKIANEASDDMFEDMMALNKSFNKFIKGKSQ